MAMYENIVLTELLPNPQGPVQPGDCLLSLRGERAVCIWQNGSIVAMLDYTGNANRTLEVLIGSTRSGVIFKSYDHTMVYMGRPCAEMGTVFKLEGVKLTQVRRSRCITASYHSHAAQSEGIP